MAAISKEELEHASQDAGTLADFVNGPAGQPNVNRAGNDVGTLATLKQQALDAASDAANLQTYVTKADMDADTSQSVGTAGDVMTGSSAGRYVWNGTTWAWATNQPASEAAIVDARNQIASLVRKAEVQYEFHNQYPAPEGVAGKGFLTLDRDNRVIGSATTSGEWFLLGISSPIAPGEPVAYEFHNTPNVENVAVAYTDRDDVVFAKFSSDGVFTAMQSGSNGDANSGVFPLKPTQQILGSIGYGQSLSVGARGQPPLSTSQPYSNLTFGQGPRSGRPGSAAGGTGTQVAIPLIENTSNTMVSGSPDPGETHCSGMANYFSVMMKDWGIDPNTVPVFASAAGHGGYKLSQLGVGSTWLQVWKDHVTQQAARARELGKEYIIPVLIWIQGESDSGTDQTEYREGLLELYEYQVAFVKATTGQTWTPPLHFYQPWASQAGFNVAKVLLSLAREFPHKFRLVTPIYRIPRAVYAGDGTHLSNVGYKWMGCYFGRALFDVVMGREAKNFIMPGRPVYVGSTTIRIPHTSGLPLQLSGTTPQRGYKVLADGVDVPITDVSLVGSDVFLTLGSEVEDLDSLMVRYARDYKEDGVLMNGGMGDLCDTDPTEVVIDGEPRSLRSWCPSFIEQVTYSEI